MAADRMPPPPGMPVRAMIMWDTKRGTSKESGRNRIGGRAVGKIPNGRWEPSRTGMAANSGGSRAGARYEVADVDGRVMSRVAEWEEVLASIKACVAGTKRIF